MKSAIRIGAPNSVMRHASEASWGENNWAVYEYIDNKPVVRAAQTTKSGAEQFMAEGRFLIDLSIFKEEESTQ